jgi:hypothetical protein
MNLRILKKLSKKAVPHLARLVALPCEPFVSKLGGRGPDYCECTADVPNIDRKHMVRRRHDRSRVRIFTIPPNAWDGTPFVGATSGYYEPEWDEWSAWNYLKNHALHAHAVDWTEDGPRVVRKLTNPRRVFALAREVAP